MVEQLTQCLHLADILDLMLMTNALGQDIHLVIITTHMSKVIENQPCDALQEANVSSSCCLYNHWSDQYSCLMRVTEHYLVSDVNR